MASTAAARTMLARTSSRRTLTCSVRAFATATKATTQASIAPSPASRAAAANIADVTTASRGMVTPAVLSSFSSAGSMVGNNNTTTIKPVTDMGYSGSYSGGPSVLTRDPEAALNTVAAAAPTGPAVTAANATARAKVAAAQPVLTGVAAAYDVVPALSRSRYGARLLLHSGPPTTWAAMPPAMRGAVVAAVLMEGWAESAEEACELAASGDIRFAPGHDHGCTGSGAGIVGPSTPVFVVENGAAVKAGAVAGRATAQTSRVAVPLQEGVAEGPAAAAGAHDAHTLARLKWIKSELAPALAASLRAATAPLNLRCLAGRLTETRAANTEAAAAATAAATTTATSVTRGTTKTATATATATRASYTSGLHTAEALQDCAEEVEDAVAAHADAVALAKAVARHCATAGGPFGTVEAAEAFLVENAGIFHGLLGGAAHCMLGAARDTPHSTLVTAMASNGVDFGVRLAGSSDAWFTAPAPRGNDGAAALGDALPVLRAGSEAATMVTAAQSSDAGEATQFMAATLGLDARMLAVMPAAQTVVTGLQLAHATRGVARGPGNALAPADAFASATAAVVMGLSPYDGASTAAAALASARAHNGVQQQVAAAVAEAQAAAATAVQPAGVQQRLRDDAAHQTSTTTTPMDAAGLATRALEQHTWTATAEPALPAMEATLLQDARSMSLNAMAAARPLMWWDALGMGEVEVTGAAAEPVVPATHRAKRWWSDPEVTQSEAAALHEAGVATRAQALSWWEGPVTAAEGSALDEAEGAAEVAATATARPMQWWGADITTRDEAAALRRAAPSVQAWWDSAGQVSQGEASALAEATQSVAVEAARLAHWDAPVVTAGEGAALAAAQEEVQAGLATAPVFWDAPVVTQGEARAVVDARAEVASEAMRMAHWDAPVVTAGEAAALAAAQEEVQAGLATAPVFWDAPVVTQGEARAVADARAEVASEAMRMAHWDAPVVTEGEAAALAAAQEEVQAGLATAPVFWDAPVVTQGEARAVVNARAEVASEAMRMAHWDAPVVTAGEAAALAAASEATLSSMQLAGAMWDAPVVTMSEANAIAAAALDLD